MHEVAVQFDVLPMHSESLPNAASRPEKEPNEVGEVFATGELVAVNDGEPTQAFVRSEGPSLASVGLDRGHLANRVVAHGISANSRTTDTGEDCSSEFRRCRSMLTASQS